MGYSGLVVIARSATRLDELTCIDDLLVAFTDIVLTDGWRIGFLGPIDDTEAIELAQDLLAETGAPAIALSVFDSDAAVAVAIDRSGHLVHFYLNEQALQELADDDYEVEPLNAQAIRGLVAWAADAGIAADTERIAIALAQSPGAFGDGIIEFAAALGIAESPV